MALVLTNYIADSEKKAYDRSLNVMGLYCEVERDKVYVNLREKRKNISFKSHEQMAHLGEQTQIDVKIASKQCKVGVLYDERIIAVHSD